MSSNSGTKFSQPLGGLLAEFACRNVYERGAPVLYAADHHNGDWQMMCGGHEHVDDDEQIVVLHKEHLGERDPGLTEVFDLLPGWEAQRDSQSAPWTRQPFEDDDDD